MISCIAAVVLCTSAFAEDICVVYAEKGYMPYYSADATRGMYIEFLKKFEKHHPQFPFVLKPYSRKRMTLMMQNGDAHVFALNSPAFADTKAYLFTETIWKETSVIFMRTNDLFLFKEPSNLFGKRLGIILGNKYPALERYFQSKDIETHDVVSSVQLFKLLRSKRIKAFVGDKYVTLYRLKQEGFEGQFEYASTPLFEFDLTIQVQKTHQPLVDAMNRFIQESKDNGFLYSLEEKYVQ
ncbi:MAG: transporter substrate-binding domain-containing protein [Desulfobacula sp.]|uniref:substrate-binding periplasmic protein n=1 Tax=Desulfobacula sp. TaxID=2593537 RepID=UPI0025C534A8|nr:transporter substrate-binding domain-containing protein [Desulfobacula sp.]MCD4719557.1 transporter substrate-binding domain-containing protein [Desulfobacula sp.]